MANVIQRLTWP